MENKYLSRKIGIALVALMIANSKQQNEEDPKLQQDRFQVCKSHFNPLGYLKSQAQSSWFHSRSRDKRNVESYKSKNVGFFHSSIYSSSPIFFQTHYFSTDLIFIGLKVNHHWVDLSLQTGPVFLWVNSVLLQFISKFGQQFIFF